jgi:hypothetical protein
MKEFQQAITTLVRSVRIPGPNQSLSIEFKMEPRKVEIHWPNALRDKLLHPAVIFASILTCTWVCVVCALSSQDDGLEDTLIAYYPLKKEALKEIYERNAAQISDAVIHFDRNARWKAL